jgi:hypothetical protein
MKQTFCLLLLLFYFNTNFCLAGMVFTKDNTFDQGVLLAQQEEWLLPPGATMRLTESRFAPTKSTLWIKSSFSAQGKKDKPAVITFAERDYDFSQSMHQVIEIEDETVVKLPAGVEVVEYEPKEYVEKGFENEIYQHMSKGANFYPWLFAIAAVAYLNKK